jgi:peptidoglycan/xylan/chitin deacetylase (PgdA/CDA1 family)
MIETRHILFLILLTLACILAVPAQDKEVAVTIDDLPLNGPDIGIDRLRKMTGSLLEAFHGHRVPVVGFVNESLLYVPGETEARIALLKTWADSGAELGNHTFGHTRFSNLSEDEYYDEVIRGDTITRRLIGPRKPRYFRHPFLKMGTTFEIESRFERFLTSRGYRIAPVTIDTMDWMFLAAYADTNKESRKKVSEEYLKFAAAKFEAAEKAGSEMFGRPVRHILLLHANELNADNLDAFFAALERRGYKFVTLEWALDDAIYRFPDKYADTSDWLSHWAFSKDKKLKSPAPPEFIQKAYADVQKRE